MWKIENAFPCYTLGKLTEHSTRWVLAWLDFAFLAAFYRRYPSVLELFQVFPYFDSSGG